MSAIEELRHERLSLVVVDDARTGRTYFTRALRKAGYEDIRVAESAARVLDMVAERPADVLIADWMMPGMDGLELTQHVRARDEEEGRYTAVILSTAREGVEALVDAFRHGVDDFLHKPFDVEELIARIFAAGNHANAQNMLLEASETLARGLSSRAEHWANDRATGLGNADYFEAQLTTYLMEAAMRGGAVCCTLLEVSGPALEPQHRARSLPRIGRRIVRAVRPTDAVAHLQDGRFGLVMSAPARGGFRDAVFSRIRREVGGRPVRPAQGSRPDAFVRSGAALWEGPGNALAPSQMIARAQHDLERH